MEPLREGNTIRAARSDDFEAVTALLEALGRERVTDETRETCRAVFREQVVDPSAHHMVVEDRRGQIVGFCSLHFRMRLNYVAEEAWIPDLYVQETVRREGIGLALLEEAERRALARGCWLLTLESGHQRAEAHDLYRRFRMRDAGRYFAKRLAPEGETRTPGEPTQL
jgi:GNAT superfamily N-acetyltransferase